MYGITKNNLGKIEKNKNVKEGKCIFPFKYKYKTHDGCLSTPKGDICATSVSKYGTLKTYGYCQKRKRKTIKKKKKLKIIYDVSPVSKMSTSDKKATMKIKPPYNDSFIGLLGDLEKLMIRKGEPMRARAYQKAQQSLILYDAPIYDITQISDLKGIGKTIMAKFQEYLDTGKLRAIEKERENPMLLFTNIYGVGPKKAEALIKKGIKTIAQLRENQEELNDKQKLGLQYYEDIEQRIPRSEIDDYAKLLKTIFGELDFPNASMEIVGSYRRGAKNSGDIDVIMTDKEDNPKLLERFVASLVDKGILLHKLTDGKTKVLAIAQLPGKKVARRVDLLYTPPKEYAFAILYFTGSKIFNTVMRQRALNMGYTLNEHGINEMVSGKKGAKVDQVFPDEKSIFDFLNMEYKNPEERTDARAVKNKLETVVSGVSGVSGVSAVSTDDTMKGKCNKRNPPPPCDKGMIEKKRPNGSICCYKTKTKTKTQTKTKTKETGAGALASGISQKTIKKRVIKPSPATMMKQFIQKGSSYLDSLTEKQLVDLLVKTNDLYYNNPDKVILSDEQFDIIKEYFANKYPDHPFLAVVGAPIIGKKDKVALPYPMPSMDKIKPESGALSKWLAKYNKPKSYLISAKLDGTSGLYTTIDGVAKLYTRGDGLIGKDITHLIPYLKLPDATKNPGLVLRGEFVISKKVFADHFKGKGGKNARNTVAGLINTLVGSDQHNYIDFVGYEVMQPEITPEKQMKMMEDKLKMNTVKHKLMQELTNELLSDILVDWRANYKYEIDGIIVAHNKVYSERKNKNPEHAFAFKMVLSDQVAEAKVVDVLWSPSKDGYLKPRVQIEPIDLGGVTITYATGKNAAFIESNKIGVGTIIKLVRSGDVIPDIKEVVLSSKTPLMPEVPYVWNNTHVDVMLVDKSIDPIVREKNILGFFKTIDVEGMGPGVVKKMIDAGYDSVPAILRMTEDDMLTLEGFKKTLAHKIYTNIQKSIKNASLPILMKASNIFGRGFGERKISPALKKYPSILIDNETDADKVAKLETVSGWSTKTSVEFVKHIQDFVTFMKECGLDYKIRGLSKGEEGALGDAGALGESHPLYGKRIVITGFRPKELIADINKVGGVIGTSVSKKTFAVIVKDIEEDTGKADQARKLGVPIMTMDTFKDAYNLS